MSEDKTVCPHCGVRMKKWRAPPLSTWSSEYFFVCFNDECSYYRRGWKGLEEGAGTGCSYRHHFDPETGTSGPLPVKSHGEGRDDIID